MSIKRSSAFLECRGTEPKVDPKHQNVRENGSSSARRPDEYLLSIAKADTTGEAARIRPLSKPLPCPCCGGDVYRPSLQIVSYDLGLPPQQAAILAAVWAAKGYPCPTSRIMDAIWADDPDGGPPPERARLYFKTQLSLLRKRLEGSGVSIETVGFRRGYRLVMGDV